MSDQSRQGWDGWFMTLARHVASKSKDPSTQCGAVLVDRDNRILSAGYNGLPKGVPDDEAILHDRAAKLRLILHAEENALLFARQNVAGATCYVWPIPPCAKCMAKLIQAGVARVVAPQPTREQFSRWGEDWDLANWAAAHAGVVLDTWEGS